MLFLNMDSKQLKVVIDAVYTKPSFPATNMRKALFDGNLYAHFEEMSQLIGTKPEAQDIVQDLSKLLQLRNNKPFELFQEARPTILIPYSRINHCPVLITSPLAIPTPVTIEDHHQASPLGSSNEVEGSNSSDSDLFLNAPQVVTNGIDDVAIEPPSSSLELRYRAPWFNALQMEPISVMTNASFTASFCSSQTKRSILDLYSPSLQNVFEPMKWYSSSEDPAQIPTGHEDEMEFQQDESAMSRPNKRKITSVAPEFGSEQVLALTSNTSPDVADKTLSYLSSGHLIDATTMGDANPTPYDLATLRSSTPISSINGQQDTGNDQESNGKSLRSATALSPNADDDLSK